MKQDLEWLRAVAIAGWLSAVVGYVFLAYQGIAFGVLVGLTLASLWNAWSAWRRGREYERETE